MGSKGVPVRRFGKNELAAYVTEQMRGLNETADKFKDSLPEVAHAARGGALTLQRLHDDFKLDKAGR